MIDKPITTYADLWNYVSNDLGNTLRYAKYYLKRPTPEGRAFWEGILAALTTAGVISKDVAENIFNGITE